MVIPTASANAVNTALVDAVGPEAAGTFHMHPVIDDEGTPDLTLMVASWDLAATGHEALKATIAAAIEANGKTGSGKTLKTAEIKVGPEPRTATKIAASDLTAASDSLRVDSR